MGFAVIKQACEAGLLKHRLRRDITIILKDSVRRVRPRQGSEGTESAALQLLRCRASMLDPEWLAAFPGRARFLRKRYRPSGEVLLKRDECWEGER